MRGVGWEGCWGGGVEEGGTNRCARLHAVAARPHCRLTLNCREMQRDMVSGFLVISPPVQAQGSGVWLLTFPVRTGRQLMQVLSILETLRLTHTHSHTLSLHLMQLVSGWLLGSYPLLRC